MIPSTSVAVVSSSSDTPDLFENHGLFPFPGVTGTARRTAGVDVAVQFAAMEDKNQQVDMNRHARSMKSTPPKKSAPGCVYPMTPLNGAQPDPVTGLYKGSDLKGTPAYERFVHILMNPRTSTGTALDRKQAAAAMSELTFKPGMKLVAECQDDPAGGNRPVIDNQKPLALLGCRLMRATVE